MESAKLNDWMQVVGIFSLVASLIFVGLQMKQSQEIAIAAQYHERAALAVEYFDSHWVSGDLESYAEGCGQEIAPGKSAEEVGRDCVRDTVYLFLADNHLYQYESGFMDEAAWQAQRELLKANLTKSGSTLRDTLQRSDRFAIRRESFIRLCEQLIEEYEKEVGLP
jgi:hypothetical protein